MHGGAFPLSDGRTPVPHTPTSPSTQCWASGRHHWGDVLVCVWLPVTAAAADLVPLPLTAARSPA